MNSCAGLSRSPGYLAVLMAIAKVWRFVALAACVAGAVYALGDAIGASPPAARTAGLALGWFAALAWWYTRRRSADRGGSDSDDPFALEHGEMDARADAELEARRQERQRTYEQRRAESKGPRSR